jgi:hypothetical protein
VNRISRNYLRALAKASLYILLPEQLRTEIIGETLLWSTEPSCSISQRIRGMS